MAADLAIGVPARLERSAGAVIARQTARRCLRSAALWGYVFGITVASSALSYGRIYKTHAERQRLAATFGSNHAASALFGPAPQLQTVAGFTAFKVSMTLMVIGAIWGLLTSTRLLRGDEDAGRWEVLLSGRTTRRRAVLQVLGGLAAGVGILWVITALVTVVVGRSSSVHISVAAGLYLALALVTSAVMFLAVGALASQLAANRRQAAGYGGVFLGASYALRMAADAGTGLHWLVWASPLGWVEQLQPLVAPRPWALVPVACFAGIVGALAVYFAGRRDLGASVWRDRTTKDPHVRLLSGPTGLTLRLTRSSITWWIVAVAVCGLLMGVVSKAAGTTIVGSSVKQIFSRLGSPGTGADAFLGIAFLIMAIVVGFEAAAEVNAARSEEAEGRLDHLLADAVSRSKWFSGRLIVGVAALIITGITAGVFSWIGAASEHSGVSFTTALDAGLNIVPASVFVLGIGALTVGLSPRRTTAVVYVVLGWSVLIEFVGGFFVQNHWVLDTSLFHQMASAPAVSPHWWTDAVLVVLGMLAMVVGDRALRLRDLQGE